VVDTTRRPDQVTRFETMRRRPPSLAGWRVGRGARWTGVSRPGNYRAVRGGTVRV